MNQTKTGPTTIKMKRVIKGLDKSRKQTFVNNINLIIINDNFNGNY